MEDYGRYSNYGLVILFYEEVKALYRAHGLDEEALERTTPERIVGDIERNPDLFLTPRMRTLLDEVRRRGIKG